MNRLDLIVSERELERLCAALTNAGAPGYTVLRHVTGRGHGGTVSEGMEFSGVGANAHVIVFCEAAALGAIRDAVTAVTVMTVWKANYSVYGVHKMWKALQRAGEDIGRDQVARIMRGLGIAGARRGGKVFTTRPDDKAARPPDLV
jgi:nitrogen regulatory protein PII